MPLEAQTILDDGTLRVPHPRRFASRAAAAKGMPTGSRLCAFAIEPGHLHTDGFLYMPAYRGIYLWMVASAGIWF
jgi:hypothetical protein